MTRERRRRGARRRASGSRPSWRADRRSRSATWASATRPRRRALAAALLGATPAAVCGRGTGLDDDGLARKVDVVGARARACNDPDPADPVGVLAAVGGFEIAVLAGVALGRCGRGVPVVLDGFITGAAALARRAARAGRAPGRLIASHRSPEPGARARARRARARAAARPRPAPRRGHRRRARAAARPRARSRMLDEMATFDGAGVTDAGR